MRAGIFKRAILFITISFFVALSSCEKTPTSPVMHTPNDIKTKRYMSPFSSRHFDNTKNAYYFITLTFEDNHIKVDENTRIIEVPGEFRYQSGDLNVMVLDQQGKIIADYLMQDPLLIH